MGTGHENFQKQNVIFEPIYAANITVNVISLMLALLYYLQFKYIYVYAYKDIFKY